MLQAEQARMREKIISAARKAEHDLQANSMGSMNLQTHQLVTIGVPKSRITMRPSLCWGQDSMGTLLRKQIYGRQHCSSCAHTCAHICLYTCLYKRRTRIWTRIYTHVYPRTEIRVRRCAGMNVSMRGRMRDRTHEHTREHMHAPAHPCMCARTHAACAPAPRLLRTVVSLRTSKS